MRLKYIVPFAWGREGLAARDALVPRATLMPGTVVETVPVRGHPAVGGTGVSHYESALLDAFMLDAAVHSEAEGYDAVVMDTTSDSAIYALRSRLSIPVVGGSMASYALANLLGLRMGIVCYLDSQRRWYESKLDFYKCRDRCVSIRALGFTPDYEHLYSDDGTEAFERMTAVARVAIEEDGAEIIVLGSTTMHQAQAFMAERLPAPVVSPGPAALKLAELIVALGLSHSKLSFPAPVTVEDEVWARIASGGPDA